WNPQGEPRSAAENATLRQALVDRVRERGISHWPARGRDPVDSSHTPEEGLTLFGLGREEAAVWAGSFGQLAIFEITDCGLTVLPIAPRRSERPIHYLWAYDPTRDHVEISRDYARPVRSRRHHEELAELVGHAPDRIHGKALVRPHGYRIFDTNHQAVERSVRERIARAVAALEVEEGFRLAGDDGDA
ncbi:MAG: DUF3293 domain-containing protein, partial [Actinomycetota bacterium]|nr:DUF3293 domain-containing protein [Actinomycetota bacterium]